jgi:AbrB family looped-hinge helix DNA binding protein
MTTTITSKGQVTVPKIIRDSMGLVPGAAVEFSVNEAGQVVLSKSGVRHDKPSRFEAGLGKAQIKWKTDELMALLRPDD